MTDLTPLPISKQTTKIPALSESANLRYFSFTMLYIAQGIPEGMLFYGIPAWMAMNGKSVTEIGSFVAIIIIPWSFKIVVAPLMDRYTYLAMGRRRPWVLFGQLGLMAAFIGLALVPDPLNNLNQFMIAGFCVSFFGAFQDVATDGMAIDVIPLNQQSKANGIMYGAKIAGTAASLSLGSWLLNQYNFTVAILSLSIMVCLIMLVPLLIKERPGEKILPWTKGTASKDTVALQLSSWVKIFKSLFQAILLPYSLLLGFLLFLNGATFSYILTLLPVFTVQELGWTDQLYSQVYALTSLIGGVGGIFFGGFLLTRFGKVKMLNLYFISLIAVVSIMAFTKIYWGNDMFVKGFMLTVSILYVFTSIGTIAMSMQFSWKRISASQFTFYMTVTNLGYAVGPTWLGPVRSYVSWEYTILFVGALSAISLFAIQFMKSKKHMIHIEKLDAQIIK